MISSESSNAGPLDPSTSTINKMRTQQTSLLDRMIDEVLPPLASIRSPTQSMTEHAVPSNANDLRQNDMQQQQLEQCQNETPQVAICPPLEPQQPNELKGQMDQLQGQMTDMQSQMLGIESKIDRLHDLLERLLVSSVVQVQANATPDEETAQMNNQHTTHQTYISRTSEIRLPMSAERSIMASHVGSSAASAAKTIPGPENQPVPSLQQIADVLATTSTSFPSEPFAPPGIHQPLQEEEHPPLRHHLVSSRPSMTFKRDRPSFVQDALQHATLVHQTSGRSIKVHPSNATNNNSTVNNSSSSFNSSRNVGPSKAETIMRSELASSLVSEDVASKVSIRPYMRPKNGASANHSSARSITERGWQHPNEEQYIRQIALDSFLSHNTNQSSEPSQARHTSMLKTIAFMTLQRQTSLANLTTEEKMHRFSFHHESPRRVVWDAIVMLFVLLDAILTPFALSFAVHNRVIACIDILGNIVFILDFFTNFLTTFTSDRGAVLVSEPKQTIRNYLRSRWVLCDLMSCFPWEDLVPNASIGRVLGVAKCVRLSQIPSLARKILPLGISGVLSIFGLLGVVFLVSHINACVWNWVGEEWRQSISGYDDQSLFWKYSLCWSVAIGALNASPPVMANPKEEITISLYMIMGNVIQATVFGSFAHLISSFNEQDDAYHTKLMFTHERCRFLGIPEALSKRIQLYYQNLYRETKSISANADEFINELSPALICDVKYQLYRDMLKQIPFLASRRVDNSVVELLVMHLTAVIFMKDDVVARKGERGEWMGFIGAKGSVAVLENSHHTHRIRRVLRKGDYFGETALFHQQIKREYTIVALNWVQVHQLHRRDFETVKQSNPDQATILEEEMSKYMSSKAANRF